MVELRRFLIQILVLLVVAGARAEWSDEFASVGPPLSTVNSTLWWDGRLVVAGDGGNLSSVLAWDGERWLPLGDVTGQVQAIAETGGRLVAAGTPRLPGLESTPPVLVFDGAGWTAPIADLSGSVQALATSNGRLFLGGRRLQCGDTVLGAVAEISGARCVPLGLLDGSVKVLAVSGGQLVAGGEYLDPAGSPRSGIAIWDGSAWNAPGGGILGKVSACRCWVGRCRWSRRSPCWTTGSTWPAT